MSNWLDNYEGVWERFSKFKAEFPDYRHNSHVLAESLSKDSDVFIVKTELWRTWNDTEPFATGLSSEPKSKQYAIELAETGSLGRALQMAGYAAKNGNVPQKPIQTTKPQLAEFIKEQRPSDPEPIVWDVTAIANEFGAEIVDEIPLCNHGPMILKQGNKDGKEYRGWVCSERNKSAQCSARWQRIGSDGKWTFQK